MGDGTGTQTTTRDIIYVHSQTITALNFHNYVDEIHILMSESRLCWSVSKVKVISAPKIINSEINYLQTAYAANELSDSHFIASTAKRNLCCPGILFYS